MHHGGRGGVHHGGRNGACGAAVVMRLWERSRRTRCRSRATSAGISVSRFPARPVRRYTKRESSRCAGSDTPAGAAAQAIRRVPARGCSRCTAASGALRKHTRTHTHTHAHAQTRTHTHARTHTHCSGSPQRVRALRRSPARRPTDRDSLPSLQGRHSTNTDALRPSEAGEALPRHTHTKQGAPAAAGVSCVRRLLCAGGGGRRPPRCGRRRAGHHAARRTAPPAPLRWMAPLRVACLGSGRPWGLRSRTAHRTAPLRFASLRSASRRVLAGLRASWCPTSPPAHRPYTRACPEMRP
jgi:hypothetical protein